MPFDKVETQVDFPAQERAILMFWNEINAFEKLREKNRGHEKWSFLDGPITANNPMGVHHAWGRTYKDAYQRYHAMLGQELRYQNGFDCQGLWVEVEVEKELKLRNKRDIENLVPGDRFASIDRFVQLCKDRVNKFARVQTEQSIRLGYWMDWDQGEDWQKPPDQRRSYFTMSEENNYTIWSFLKKCFERGLVYKAYDAMPWCPRCAVGLSQMEMHEGYRLVAHRAVFVKFPLRNSGGSTSPPSPPTPLPASGARGEEGILVPLAERGEKSDSPRPGTPGRRVGGEGEKENLLVWTTTPWTLTSNVGAAVNPKLHYLKVRHRDEIYYVARGAFTARRKEEEFKRKEWVEGVPKLKTLEQIFKEKGGYEIVGEVAGADMLGWTYEGPFDELPAQQSPGGAPRDIADVVLKQKWASAKSASEVHRVIAWDAVGEAEGTGIVHIAPGCGKEDFLLGKEEQLVPIAPLDEEGVYVAGFGPLEGKSAVAHDTTDWILNNLQEKGVLLAIEKYPHSYPHCWRCKSELLFRLVDEWFINMSWREEIMKVCHDIRWIPDFGLQRELDWLKNMGDWMISKKRFWGLALPIWVCAECDWFDVIGSREELQKRAVEGWDRFAGHTPHRPWIDQVKIKCAKCGAKAARIPDVGNPWLDAGIVPYSTMKYNSDRQYWQQWFPADFITECFPGQFRNWFYALLAMSTMMEQRAPFKVLLGHALVRDEFGREMHKSLGNAIPFEGAADVGYQLADDKGQMKSYGAMSADLIRWMFCRHNPVNNINFGPGPAEEVRSKFIMKLWNTYAFFCNYARLDKFDPAAPQVPVKDRPDIDRWILSDLQQLVQKAHKDLSEFNMQSFCLEAEDFVDNRLSNWYVRRNRRRFWKSELGQDKTAAYQTLYTVLLTLTKLLSPMMPFLTEVMYQNLKAAGDNEESVHHCTYPVADATLIDNDLSEDMHALLRLVSLGSAARNSVKIKVRQPLAELKIQPGDECDRRAVERFADQICEELNLKKVTLHDPANGSLVRMIVKANLKTLGPKSGSKLQSLKRLVETGSPGIIGLIDGTQSETTLNVDGDAIVVTRADIITTPESVIEGWAGLADRKTQLALDTRITEDLQLEGLAREVVRHVQSARKDANLNMEDRIVPHLHTETAALQSAIDKHRDYIAQETLVSQWAAQPLSGDGVYRTTVKVEGQPLTIELRKA